MAQHYSVFLSYRHKPKDAAATKCAFNVLEAYRLPAALKRAGYAGVQRVFRDTEELSVSRVLSNTIADALKNSDCLVVVCSPDTPESEWVDREVATFIELGRAERIFPLLIAGTPENAFPPSLKKIPDIMERVMDARNGGRMTARAPGVLLRVVAAVAGCPYEALVRADRMQKSRRSAAGAALAVLLAAAVTGISGMLWMRAAAYRAEAEREQAASMAVLSHLTYDLPNKLVELPRTYGAVAEILDENVQQINRILNLSENPAGIRKEMAANYEKYATASARIGAYERAYESEQEAIALYRALSVEESAQWTPALASAYNNLGVVCNAAGAYAQASEAYGEAVALLEPVYADDPALVADLAAFLSNSGANSMDAGENAAAKQALTRSVSLYTSLASEGTNAPPAGDASLIGAVFNLGVCCMNTGDYDEAETYLTRAVEAYGAQYAALPNRTNLSPYANALSQRALCLSSAGKLDAAVAAFPEAIALLEKLAAGGDDAAADMLLASACNNYGYCRNMRGEYGEAAPWYLRYAEMMEALYEKTGTDLARARMARAYYNVAENAFKAGDYAATRTYYDRCLAEYAPVYEALGSYHAAEYWARVSYYHIIVKKNFKAALEEAEKAAALQPDSSFVQIVRMYALLYNKRYDACDAAATEILARSAGERINIERDFAALCAAGLAEPHMDAVLALPGA